MQIKILGQIFEIEETDFLGTEDGNVVFGKSDFTNNKILINKNTKEDRKGITILHEIIHCILTSLRFDDENQNETLVSSLAESIYLVLKENETISFLK